jgi:RecB family exonuclease
VTAAEQLPLDGMPVRLFACTPSRLATFTDCPRRYRMTYLDRPVLPKGPPWAHNSLGAAVHTALRRWWELPRARRVPAAAGALLDGSWLDEGFRDAEQSAWWRDQARGWVISYVEGLDPDDEPVGVERQVATRTRRLALTGRVDRIDARGDELVIVDYKAGRRAPTRDDARSSFALACYALGAVRTLHRPCRRVELHHLRTGSVVDWTHTDESLARHVARAENTADDIVAATDTLSAGAKVDDVFPARVGRHCGWCDYRRHCREGQAAEPELAPWAMLDAAASAPVSPDQAAPGSVG